MAGPKSSLTFSSLQKYTRRRQLFAKNGFYLAINSTGEVTGTSDETCLYGKKIFLSFVCIFFDLDFANLKIVSSHEYFGFSRINWVAYALIAF